MRNTALGLAISYSVECGCDFREGVNLGKYAKIPSIFVAFCRIASRNALFGILSQGFVRLSGRVLAPLRSAQYRIQDVEEVPGNRLSASNAL